MRLNRPSTVSWKSSGSLKGAVPEATTPRPCSAATESASPRSRTMSARRSARDVNTPVLVSTVLRCNSLEKPSTGRPRSSCGARGVSRPLSRSTTCNSSSTPRVRAAVIESTYDLIVSAMCPDSVQDQLSSPHDRPIQGETDVHRPEGLPAMLGFPPAVSRRVRDGASVDQAGGGEQPGGEPPEILPAYLDGLVNFGGVMAVRSAEDGRYLLVNPAFEELV